jgi:hypothetical protein
LVLSLAMGVAAQATPVRAEITLGVSPSIVELSGEPGQNATVDIEVLNQGDEAFDATAEPVPYGRVDASLSAPEWLSVAQSSIHTEPGGSATVSVTVAFPEDQPSGARYAGLSIKTVAGDAASGQSGVTGGIVVAFLMTVEGEGELERSGEINRFAAVLEMDGRLGFRAELSDTGNIHWDANGMAFVKKEDGSDYGSLEFQPARAFPQGVAVSATSSTLPVEAGASFTASAEFDYGADDPLTAETEFTFTPDFAVDGSICENLDRGPTITTELINNGDLGIMFGTRIIIATADGQPLGQSNPGDPQVAWPNDTSSSFADLPDRLPSGDYLMSIEAVTGTGAPVIAEIPFAIGGSGPNVAPICPQPESTPDTD